VSPNISQKWIKSNITNKRCQPSRNSKHWTCEMQCFRASRSCCHSCARACVHTRTHTHLYACTLNCLA